MSFRVLAGRVGLAGKAAARRQRGSLIADGAFASHRPQVATALTPTDRSTRTGMNHQAYGLSSQAEEPIFEGIGKRRVWDDGKKSRRVRRTEDEVLEIEVHKAAVLQYKKDMTALRKDIEKETKDRRYAESVEAALERRRVGKLKKANFAIQCKRASINIALNEKRQAKEKANYEAGFKECARIFYERQQRKKNIHGILLEELEAESKFWVSTPEDITTKITDDIWEIPGNNSAGGQITMPDDHLWRFSADVGLYEQEEEASERNAYLRTKMYARMANMQNADTYLRDRHTRWDNDTRGLLKEADRLLRKGRPAPPGYMARLHATQMKE